MCRAKFFGDEWSICDVIVVCFLNKFLNYLSKEKLNGFTSGDDAFTDKSSKSVEAPLLQYNALIAMLKSNASAKAQKEHILNLKGASATASATATASSNRSKKSSTSNLPVSPSHNNTPNKSSSPKLIHKSNSSNNKNKHHRNGDENATANATALSMAKWSTFKKYQVIDADSISLASLSESPPSEFKFSDEEETTTNNNNNNNDYEEESARVIRQNSLLLNKQQQHHQINEAVNKIRKLSANSFDSKLTNNNSHSKGSNQVQNTTPPVANVSEHIGSNTNASNHMSEINKNLERQRVWQEQMNQIKIAKKNFHAVLLKDAKCKLMNLILDLLIYL